MLEGKQWLAQKDCRFFVTGASLKNSTKKVAACLGTRGDIYAPMFGINLHLYVFDMMRI